MEANELSKRARGGTEQMLERLHRDLPPELLGLFQIIPTRVRDLASDRKRILWVHDTQTDPEVQHLGNLALRKRFDGIVFVSHWQRAMFCERFGLPHGETRVIPNGIEPFVVDSTYFHKRNEPVRLVYHTTPHRGLELLVPAFAHLAREDGGIHLDVFSSFEIYGWAVRDEPYRRLFDYCHEHPQITYHGFVPNDEVREALRNAHLFAYPCVWPETSCISMIEAMCAGCTVLSSDLGALPETVAKWGTTYPFVENTSRHHARFIGHLEGTIASIREGNNTHAARQAEFANDHYSWPRIAGTWVEYLSEMKSYA